MVNLLLPAVYQSTCYLDVTYFPWDHQTCNLTFGSWTYDMAALDLRNMTAEESLDQFAVNSEWTVERMPVTRHITKYKCCEHPFATLEFSIIMRRKAMYYVTNLILPCSFITISAIFVFYLPPNSGEKVSLAVTVLLTSTVFLLLVAESMPPQSEVVPLIGQYKY